MLDLAAVQPGERLLDLGCGDGRIVSHAFAMDGWEPEASRQLGHLTLYLWIVGR